MKLRNKKTGEIVELFGITCINGRTFVQFDDGKGTFKFEAHSLAELEREWEDYEEPENQYYIDCDGRIFEHHTTEYIKNKMREIGNYFDTREEAEKAVEKLKAWKRLKDYNVKFNLDFVRNKIDFTYSVNNPLLSVLDGEEQIFNNMKIIFGGEE